MENKNPLPLPYKFLCISLAAALIAAAPGAQALAAVIGKTAVSGNAGVPAAGMSLPSLSAPLVPGAIDSLLAPSMGLGGLPSLSAPVFESAAPSLSAPSAVAQSAPSRIPDADTVSAPAARTADAPAARAAETAAPKSSLRSTLSSNAKAIEDAKSPSEKGAALDKIFTGSLRPGDAAEAVAVAGAGLFGRSRSLLRRAPVAFNGADSPALAEKSAAQLSAEALDASKPAAERLAAVAALRAKGASAKAALETIAQTPADAQGDAARDAADYEVHRAALRALAEDHADLRTLRPVTDAHWKAILATLASDAGKPEMAFFDYDDTLAPFNQPIAAETGEALKAAADAGVELFILTDRPDAKKRETDVTVLDSLAPLSPAQKAGVGVIASRGTRALFFDKRGEAVLVREDKVAWSKAEGAAIDAAHAVVVGAYGEQEYNGKTHERSAYGFAHFLPIGMDETRVKEAAAFFAAELSARGMDIEVSARMAKKDTDPPYLTFSKIDKRTGVLPTKADRRGAELARALVRLGAPAGLIRRALALSKRFARPVADRKVLSVGDQFYDTRNADLGFAKASPDGTQISVGGKGDPRYKNLFVAPRQEAEASREILRAVATQEPSGFQKKAVIGLFAQRTFSIGVFILTSIAYPFIAIEAVGVAQFGALMAFGPLAAIATGPLNGLIVDRLSARNAMALNTVVRAALALILPVLAALGYLNFTSLLIASVANGWLLSSIMTTEGAYVRRLAGDKHTNTVNSGAWMNYLVIQVVLGSIIGAGAIIDALNPMFAFYASAIVHAAVVLPIIWFTMPNISPAPKTLQSMGKLLSQLRAKNGAAEEVAALEKALAERSAALEKTLGEDEAAVAANAARIAELEDEAKDASRERRREIRGEINFREADNQLRRSAIAQSLSELGRGDSRSARIKKALRAHALPAGLMAAAVALYALTHAGLPVVAALLAGLPKIASTFLTSTIPIVAALVHWIASTNAFKALWYGKGGEPSKAQTALEDQLKKETAPAAIKRLKKEISSHQNRLRTAMLLLGLTAFLMYPLQYFGLAMIAGALAGAAGKGLLLGQFLGSLFLGNLIANAAKARMPDVRLPVIGMRVPGERLIQAGVLALAATWVYTGLLPGSLLAAGGAAAIAAALMWLANKLSDTGYLKLFGAGFSAIWIPYLAWTTGLMPVAPAVMLAMVVLGMFYGPSFTSLISYFHRNKDMKSMGRAVGVQGSVFNAAISFGYGLATLAASLFTPAFPSMLAVFGVLFILGGILTWRAPARLPGFPKDMINKSADGK
ncbi:MAG: hypothetical protein CO113_07030 [Elusimicrobia bacterium CG_4_9_14_3_um_filter_62_55]|nr:MAG: hypothetical protein COR54_04670 [Elusimicrobia bacterium CG22_combo_CG10-13_8_21_14_all_63_91]PJA17013.1 MAG: hypothetical protein COX66_05780 [Elusimicrobia bacterium CG_4_10_14_0_2_um_filter_63_34]PJB25736.1 MAG: hypothetical protein CO113_07030 [Elusimicrobia bacterium CG_4_9_14_3_um_filter_62_55]